MGQHLITFGFNSSLPSVAYMRCWTRSALVQVVASRLFDVRSLPEPTLTYLIGPLGTDVGEIWIGKLNFYSLICICKCRLRNSGHFVQGELRYKTVLSVNKILLSWKCIQSAVSKMPDIGSAIPVSNYFVQHLTTYNGFLADNAL